MAPPTLPWDCFPVVTSPLCRGAFVVFVFAIIWLFLVKEVSFRKAFCFIDDTCSSTLVGTLSLSSVPKLETDAKAAMRASVGLQPDRVLYLCSMYDHQRNYNCQGLPLCA